MKRIAYRDSYVKNLHEDIASLISGHSQDPASVEQRLRELAQINSSAARKYWQGDRSGVGIPDSAYKTSPPYLFPDQEPARTFQTSMTTGGRAGTASYTARGMELMGMSIVTSARRHVTDGLDQPAVVRLAPTEDAAPAMVMAYGMELISRTLGYPQLSASVLTSDGFDIPTLRLILGAAVAEQRPVVLIGATLAFVNLCTTAKAAGLAWLLPPGSRFVDAGGHKGNSREVSVDEMRGEVREVFGIEPAGHRNLFGMTELASQLYDSCDVGIGPYGQRPKAAERFVRPEVRDPFDLTPVTDGAGLLEVIDLCLIDRPCAILTGDWGIMQDAGVTIAGRVAFSRARGCSLALDTITGHGTRHV